VSAYLLVIDEAAKLLRCSPRTVHSLVGRRAIPHRRIGGTRRILFVEAELTRWIEDGCALEEIVTTDGGRIVRPAKGAS